MDYASQAAALYTTQRQINEAAYQEWLKSPYNLKRVVYKGDDNPPLWVIASPKNYGEEF